MEFHTERFLRVRFNVFGAHAAGELANGCVDIGLRYAKGQQRGIEDIGKRLTALTTMAAWRAENRTRLRASIREPTRDKRCVKASANTNEKRISTWSKARMEEFPNSDDS